MIELPSLYPHQEDLRDRTRSALAKHGRVILCAPPGMGKTRCAKWILGSAAIRDKTDKNSGFNLFTVHRRGLVDNASNSFRESPHLPHGMIMSGREPTWNKSVQVASIDTLIQWFIEDNEYKIDYTFDLIIWDEAHSHHPKFAKFLERHDVKRMELGLPPAYVIGLTATPQAKGLSEIYGEIVLGPPTQWLINEGFLSPFRYFRATQGQLGKLIKRGNEFTKDSVCQAMEGMAGDLVRDWKRFAEGRPTVGFFPRRSHAKEAAVLLEEAGLRVAYVDGETPDEERDQIYNDLNEHRIDYLCNVQVVERGTDIPRIGCVQMCVAVASVARWRQMIGRGSRCHPEKTDCIVLDHGGNLQRKLGFFEDDPHWTLDIDEKERGEVTTRNTMECPKCQAVYRGGLCSSCGYEPTRRERESQGLEFDGTELKEVTKKERAISNGVKSPEQLMTSALYIAGKRKGSWKSACKFFYDANREQGTSYRIPKTIDVGGVKYSMIPYGSPDSSKKKIKDLYPWTTERGKHGGKYCHG